MVRPAACPTSSSTPLILSPTSPNGARALLAIPPSRLNELSISRPAAFAAFPALLRPVMNSAVLAPKVTTREPRMLAMFSASLRPRRPGFPVGDQARLVKTQNGRKIVLDAGLALELGQGEGLRHELAPVALEHDKTNGLASQLDQALELLGLARLARR